MTSREPSRKPDRAQRPPSRIQRFLAPVLAGGLIDAVDLATLGPIGLSLGALAGGLVGWWLAPLLGFRPGKRWLGALLSGLYCMLPLTSVLPLASVGAGLAQSLREPNEEDPPGPAEPAPDEAIDVEFRTVREEPDSR